MLKDRLRLQLYMALTGTEDLKVNKCLLASTSCCILLFMKTNFLPYHTFYEDRFVILAINAKNAKIYIDDLQKGNKFGFFAA